jgi:ribosomal protein L40E
MLCTKCGTSNPPANNFCVYCGSALAQVCVNCKAESPPTSNFCGRCEFKATIPAEWKVLEAYSVSHGKASAWLPVLELLRKYFGFSSTDHAATRRQKVTAVLTALDTSLADAVPYLFGLLGIVEGDDPLAQMDGQVTKRRDDQRE